MITIFGQVRKRHPEFVPLDIMYFDVTNVAEYYWKSEKTDWDILRGDFPNLAPPYENFWMEYAMPDGEVIADEGVFVTSSNERMAILFQAVDMNHPDYHDFAVKRDELRWVYMIRVGAMNNGTIMFSPDIVIMIGVGQHGEPQPIDPHLGLNGHIRIYTEDPNHVLMKDDKIRAEFVKGWFGVVHPAFLAISFLHCKNVEIIKIEPEALRTKSSKRRTNRKGATEPMFRHHTLNIKPMRKILQSEGSEETKGIKHALHICRGHFKDFPEGRSPGLFGKHHGLYWWDAHVRGSKDKGVVDKDYKVQPPENEE